MTKRYVDYEWTVEEIDADGDIQDVNFWPETELSAALDYLKASGPGHRIGLLRRVAVTECIGRDWRNDSTTDEEGRDYAYPVNGFLPTECDFGTPVPARFRRINLTDWKLVE